MQLKAGTRKGSATPSYIFLGRRINQSCPNYKDGKEEKPSKGRKLHISLDFILTSMLNRTFQYIVDITAAFNHSFEKPQKLYTINTLSFSLFRSVQCKTYYIFFSWEIKPTGSVDKALWQCYCQWWSLWML